MKTNQKKLTKIGMVLLMAVASVVNTQNAKGQNIFNTGVGTRVGIGTITPTSLGWLEIKKPSGNQANLILSGQEYYIPGLTGASSNGIALINGVNRLGNKQLWLADADNIATKNSTNGVLRLFPTTGAAYVEAIATDGTTPLNLLFQTTGGKVGIGTSTPSALLDVVNTNGTSMISLQQQADADNFVSLFNNHPGRSNMVVFQPIGLTSPSNPQWNVGRAYYASNSYVINTWDGSNNTARMMFTPTGNVGIGTETPTEKLHIHSSTGVSEMRLTDANTTALSSRGMYLRLRTTRDVDLTNFEAGKALSFGTDGIERMRINGTNGNVGIGTTNPAAKLHITPSAGLKGLQIDNTSSYEIYGAGASENTNIYSEGNLLLLSGASKTLSLGTNNVDSRMLIDANGNVGIGTASPTSRFNIKGGYQTTGLNTSADELNFGASGATPNGSQVIWGDGTGWKLNFGSKSGNVPNATFVPKVTFVDNGNVGIGTTTPINKVHIDGDLRLHNRGQKIIFGSGGNSLGDSVISISRPIATDGILMQANDIYIRSHVTPIQLQAATTVNMMDLSGNTKMIVNTQTGNVGIGIGNTAPNAKLQVNGGVYIGAGTWALGSSLSRTPGNYNLFVENGILTEKVKVAVKGTANWADYVFADNYQLKPLNEVEAFVNENNHLPGIPAANEIVNEGLDLGEMQAKQMGKIEELTLYMIQMNKKIEALEKENASLKSSITNAKN